MTADGDRITLLIKQHRSDRMKISRPDSCGWLKTGIVILGIIGLILFAIGVVAFVRVIILTGG